MTKGELQFSTERAMWGAVVERVILDAKRNPDNMSKNSRSDGVTRAEMLNARGDALRWLRGNTRDFRDVCTNAGLEPNEVKRLAILKLGEEVIWGDHFRVGPKEVRNQGTDK